MQGRHAAARAGRRLPRARYGARASKRRGCNRASWWVSFDGLGLDGPAIRAFGCRQIDSGPRVGRDKGDEAGYTVAQFATIMDRFQALSTFARVVEAGSFARAAERLGVSVSAVSRQVS